MQEESAAALTLSDDVTSCERLRFIIDWDAEGFEQGGGDTGRDVAQFFNGSPWGGALTCG